MTSAFRHLLMLLLCLQASAWAWAEPWWVAGEPAAVFGTNWATDQNEMTLVNGTTYQWTSNVFTFTEATTIAFKVVKNKV